MTMLDYRAKGNFGDVIKFGDIIGVNDQLTLIQEDYSGLPGWTQCNIKVLNEKGRL